MTEATLLIHMKIPQTVALNRGIGDVMRSISLLQDGSLVLDYEQFSIGGHWTGTIVGSWEVRDE